MDVGFVIQILQDFDGIVVVDEAYIDFAPERSLLPLLNNYQNLVLIQTFSKAFGLAAARVGMAFADPAVIKALDTIKLPSNLGNPSAIAAIAALGRQEKLAFQIQRINRYKMNLLLSLNKCRV